MIEGIRNIRILTNDKYSNDEYHAEKEHISTSGLCLINDECPAAWKYQEVDKKSAPMAFGTASHAAILEPETFDSLFIRGIDKNEEGMMTSDAAVKAWLKKLGVKVAAKDGFAELVKMCIDTDESFKYLKLLDMQLEGEAISKALTVVKAEDYDNMMTMRKVVMANPDNVEMFKGATVETSIFCEILVDGVWHKVKIRPDMITTDCMVPDYKTTRSVNPEEFGRLAFNNGYWFKQAFVCDVLSAVYDRPFQPALFAQGKDAPFIPQLYMMTEQQIQVGRDQYSYALKQYGMCIADDIWPAYFDGPVELPTPDYIARRYDFDDEVEIKFED